MNNNVIYKLDFIILLNILLLKKEKILQFKQI